MANEFYKTGDVPDFYICSKCKRKRVKLWRPEGSSKPLICAICAEKMQVRREYDEVYPYGFDEQSYSPKRTGRRIEMPLWYVDKDGLIPSSLIFAPGPDGKFPMVDALRVDGKGYYSTMYPAIPDDDGMYWCYGRLPEDGCDWWRKLPTHK